MFPACSFSLGKSLFHVKILRAVNLVGFDVEQVHTCSESDNIISSSIRKLSSSVKEEVTSDISRESVVVFGCVRRGSSEKQTANEKIKKLHIKYYSALTKHMLPLDVTSDGRSSAERALLASNVLGRGHLNNKQQIRSCTQIA